MGCCATESSLVVKQSKKVRGSHAGAYAEILNLRLVAMGTMVGDILLYSFTNADLFTDLSGGHTGVVNDVVWYADTLYSCSDDHHIIIWNVSESCIKMKWKAHTGPIYSICVVDDNNILSASNSIQWWDIKQKSVLKVFNGHGSEIFKLIPLIAGNSCDYFVSAAVGDRVINAWHFKKESTTSSKASFVLPDEPANIDILCKGNESLQMSIVSQDGSFHFFEHLFNGNVKTKPLQPKFSIRIASKSNESQKAQVLPVLAAKISSGLDLSLLAYGNFLKPMFERINISDVTKDVFLIRSITDASSSGKDSISKIKQTEKSSNVKLLVPGHMTNLSFLESSSKKRKKKNLDIKELPMEERLKALDLKKSPNEISENEAAVKSDSMVHLLLQGLQSRDNNMLNTVFGCSNELVIMNTIERLPIQSIFSLLEVLFIRLHKLNPRTCLKWLTALITIHLSYFISSPDICQCIATFDQFIAARRDAVSQLARARGILSILMAQAKLVSSNSSDFSNKPLVEYNSESEEENDAGVGDFDSETKITHMSTSDFIESENSDSSDMEDD
nr:WD repeat-containing protein 43 isoform X2 [Parasteatoda tepidariorum]